MSEKTLSIKKAIPIVVVTWIFSLVTTLTIVYFAPFVPVGTNQIGDSAVTSGKIANGAIVVSKLANGSTTSAKILDGTVIAQDMADGSVITVKVADGAITTSKVADNSVTSTKVADSAIITIKLGDGAVTATKLADDAVITIKLADGAVTSAKILDGTIIAADLADNSVTSTKIANGAVTTTKIADYAITNLKLAANAIPFNFTRATSLRDKNTETWENITGMEVKLTLQRNSTLLILFSAEASISPSTSTQKVQWQAKVSAYSTEPGPVWLQPSTGYTSSVSYNFYRKGLTAGQYTIYMQWYVTGGATAVVQSRTLTVIALLE